MKKTILFCLLACSLISTAQTGLPKGSIYSGYPGVYYNRDKISKINYFVDSIQKEYVRKTASDCTCDLQSVLDNGNSANIPIIITNGSTNTAFISPYGYNAAVTGYGVVAYFGNIGSTPTSFQIDAATSVNTLNIPGRVTYDDPVAAYTCIVETDGIVVYDNGNKIADFGHDIGASPGNSYMHLFTSAGISTISMEGSTGVGVFKNSTDSNYFDGGTSKIMTAGVDQIGMHKTGSGPSFFVKSTSSSDVAEIFGNALSSNIQIKVPKYTGTLLNDYGATDTQVLTASTTITITHGLSFTPSRVFVNIRSGANTSGRVTAITPTTFTVTLPTAVTGTVVTDWQAAP